VLAVAAAIAALCSEIAARWRGIVVAHLFFLTLWMAIQVFFFATGAHWCLPGNGSRFVEWLTRSFGRVTRCTPAPPASSAFSSTAAAAAPAPAPIPASPPRSPEAIPASPLQAPAPGTAAGAPAPAPAPAPPSPPASGLLAGSGPGWSSRTIANCWRNRAIGGGDCYGTLPDPHHRPPPAPPPPRYYRYAEPTPRYRYALPPRSIPCRRAYDCWPDDGSWRDDF
jgi:hypothetical protein